MLSPINGSTQQYLNDLDRIQKGLDDIQAQVSSGIRVAKPSDDPSAVPGILNTLSEIARNTGEQSNLAQVNTELMSGDGALQQAVTLLDSATSLAMQAASSPDSAKSSELIQQVQDIQQQLISLSATTAGGRYIFGGDLDQSAFAYDVSQPNSVKALTDPTSTRVILDQGGCTLWIPKTAQEIFDLRDAKGAVASGNVFAALGDLLTALGKNDTSAAAASVDELHAASDHINQALGYYGIAETRVANASNLASQAVLAERKDLSDARDADVAGDAIQLSQLTLQQQAALAAGAKRMQNSLFNYLA